MMIKSSKITKIIALISFVILTVGISTILLVETRLDVNVPSVKIVFTTPNSSDGLPVEYSYVYEGDDLIRGVKFGGHGFSEIKVTRTGQVIEIPVKHIVSYWPFSKFTFLQVNAVTSDNNCIWIARFASDYGVSLYNDSDRTEIFRDENRQYLLRNVINKVTEIQCVTFGET